MGNLDEDVGAVLIESQISSQRDSILKAVVLSRFLRGKLPDYEGPNEGYFTKLFDNHFVLMEAMANPGGMYCIGERVIGVADDFEEADERLFGFARDYARKVQREIFLNYGIHAGIFRDDGKKMGPLS